MECKEYALYLLGRNAYTEKNLRAKLRQKEYEQKDIEKVIELCKKYNFINDVDYAKSYIRSRDRVRPRGKRLLTFELKHKGVSEADIAAAFADEEVATRSETSLAAQIIRQKILQYDKLERYKAYQKAYALLARKGFDPEVIRSVLNETFRQA